MSKKLAVVALGGNAILRENEEGTIIQQEKNVTDTLENLSCETVRTLLTEVDEDALIMDDYCS